MTAAEIQSFLDQRIGTCSNGKCLNVSTASISSRDARVSSSTGNLICSAIQGGTMRVSELIYRVQVACGISAKVILVTLQKEQGLTTSRAPSDWNLNAAMGQACPDTAPCDPAFKGLGPQIVGGVTQLKTYSAARFGKQPGSNYIQYNPNAGCGGTTINIQNWATASLYTYTPYQPNAAALAAGYGLGDGCSSYGNRNFYQYYTDWFGSTQGRDTKDDPFGNVELVQTKFGSFRVAGWAIDPNTKDPIDVHVYVDGVGYPVKANQSRADVGSAFPSFGSNHGFDAEVPASSLGNVTICLYAINVGAGANTTLACTVRESRGGSPVGSLDAVTGGDSSVQVSGWTLDPDTPDPIDVHVYVDSVGTAVRADKTRADVGAGYPAYGAEHGFSGSVKAAPGLRQVCVYAINKGGGVNSLLGCKTVTVTGEPDLGRNPIGGFEAVSVSGSSGTVAGWALDPDTVKPIAVHIYVNGAGKAYTADKTRPDIAAVYPSYGASHGFSEQVALTPGSNEVCVFAINNGAGANTSLGCKTVTVAEPDLGRNPIGGFEAVSVSGSSGTVAGWALDPDTVKPIAVHIYVNGAGKAYTADKTRPDIAAVYPSYGASHGFSEQVALTPGSNEVCVFAINNGAGANTSLGCKTVTVAEPDLGRNPIGGFEAVSVSGSSGTVAGWALDPDTVKPIAVHIYVNGAGKAYTADKTRPDIAAVYPSYGASHGFSEQVALTPGSNEVCVFAINNGAGANTSLGCKTVTVASAQSRPPFGNVELVAPVAGGVRVAGWALDPDTTSSIQVHVYVGAAGTAITASSARPDVGAAYKLGDAHGFDTVVPAASGTYNVCLYAIDSAGGSNTGMGCRSVTVP
ncbi:hypothetical protein [Microbacterium sp. RG1]|uniref:hypothetical protein n=1 Tax=Microbacterium sp. RG1 TaxID=2489212 RepID=UPI0010CA27C6|nr:hypothetical protein [Microbacterium sp. RG1]QCQ15383.1 hypothetical protein EHF32_00800 [Microbacterium sp. RG1]